MKEKQKGRMNFTVLNSPKPNCTCNWANLPNELIEKIAQHLHSRIQISRLRSVCSSWRFAISLSPSSSSSATICRLENNQSSSAFLAKVIETSSNHFHILNPLTIPNSNLVLNNTLNMLNYRLFELAKGCHLTSNAPSNDSVIVQKAVIFRDCGIVAIYGFGKLGFRVFGDENWTLLGDPKRYYDDLLFYQGEYYVIDRLGSIFWIDRQMNLFQHLPKLNSVGQLNNLVGTNGHLYVVDSYFETEEMGCARTDMKVYTMDEQWGTWVQVKSLKDQIFVLSKDVCFSVSVDDFPGCEGNCIYFTDFSYTLEENEYSGYLRHDNRSMIPIGCSTNGNSGAELGYYAYHFFSFNDLRMRYIACCPTLQRLFTPPEDCSC